MKNSIFSIKVLSYCVLVRPKQWVKNVLLFAAPFAAGITFTYDTTTKLVSGFMIFSFIASLGYVTNDWIDRKNDALNASKSHRPFAKGDLKVIDFVVVNLLLILLILAFAKFVPLDFLFCIYVYFVNTLLYSLGLKHVPVVEMVMLTFGFLLRPLAGAALLGLPVSEHFLIVVIFGSLFIIATKRLSELQKYPKQHARKVVLRYSVSFLESVITLAITLCLTAYFLWALGTYPDSVWVKASLFPMLTGLLRYSWMRGLENAESPEHLIFQDYVIPLCGIVVIVLLAVPIYG
ncbi:decaprenyl-phosphate phosphoribosyltransferase [Candidatus Planktophila lacus]|uniref:UbiA family prenyltransferase n=1 Tax=Candidatus Planktophila lacus TaxID=1884913 RepID=UPI000BACADC2|nr:UbiA family prenyltransferase [Candidatus Planktophila lacus]ASY24507.1 decaprenyl-phosphate phosphoribosyltransferase [Candidatus Planktophila lacus]